MEEENVCLSSSRRLSSQIRSPSKFLMVLRSFQSSSQSCLSEGGVGGSGMAFRLWRRSIRTRFRSVTLRRFGIAAPVRTGRGRSQPAKTSDQPRREASRSASRSRACNWSAREGDCAASRTARNGSPGPSSPVGPQPHHCSSCSSSGIGRPRAAESNPWRCSQVSAATGNGAARSVPGCPMRKAIAASSMPRPRAAAAPARGRPWLGVPRGQRRLSSRSVGSSSCLRARSRPASSFSCSLASCGVVLAACINIKAPSSTGSGQWGKCRQSRPSRCSRSRAGASIGTGAAVPVDGLSARMALVLHWSRPLSR